MSPNSGQFQTGIATRRCLCVFNYKTITPKFCFEIHILYILFLVFIMSPDSGQFQIGIATEDAYVYVFKYKTITAYFLTKHTRIIYKIMLPAAPFSKTNILYVLVLEVYFLVLEIISFFMMVLNYT